MIKRGKLLRDKYQLITWVNYGRESNYEIIEESSRLYIKEIRVINCVNY
jgi:hypothetical protein